MQYVKYEDIGIDFGDSYIYFDTVFFPYDIEGVYEKATMDEPEFFPIYEFNWELKLVINKKEILAKDFFPNDFFKNDFQKAVDDFIESHKDELVRLAVEQQNIRRQQI